MRNDLSKTRVFERWIGGCQRVFIRSARILHSNIRSFLRHPGLAQPGEISGFVKAADCRREARVRPFPDASDARKITGWAEAVACLRLPQNVACRFPALCS